MGVYGRRLACPGSRRWLRRGRWAIEHNVLVGVWTQESAGEASAGEASAGEGRWYWRARADGGGWP